MYLYFIAMIVTGVLAALLICCAGLSLVIPSSGPETTFHSFENGSTIDISMERNW